MGQIVRPIRGEILRDPRSDERRLLRLSSGISFLSDWAEAMIGNISETGLMFETSVDLPIGEIVSVELPFIGSVDARIVRRVGALYGCEFLARVSRQTINAALLQSPGEIPSSEIEIAIEEMPIGINPGLAELTAWKLEFDQTKGASGYRLVGFRKAADGKSIAMITRTN